MIVDDNPYCSYKKRGRYRYCSPSTPKGLVDCAKLQDQSARNRKGSPNHEIFVPRIIGVIYGIRLSIEVKLTSCVGFWKFVEFYGEFFTVLCSFTFLKDDHCVLVCEATKNVHTLHLYSGYYSYNRVHMDLRGLDVSHIKSYDELILSRRSLVPRPSCFWMYCMWAMCG